MSRKSPLKIRKGDGAYEVLGPIRMNGTEYPFHLFRHDAEGEKSEWTIRIAVDPYRTAKGKPLKPSSKPKPVLAVFHAETHARSTDGTVVTIDMNPIEWISSLIENPNDD